MLKITECPRDAMQGIKQMIPTQVKADYLNLLLKVGFDRLDFGSFVSPKAIPQLQDTPEVLKKLRLDGSPTKLLAIIANLRGAQDACAFDEIQFLGFPFSISETFQQRNTNSSIAESLKRVEEIQDLCRQKNKTLLVYISMAFGNPYGDLWNPDIAIHWCKQLEARGITHLALADTTGSSTPQSIELLFSSLIPELKNVEFNAHLHSVPENAMEKIEAAYNNKCRSFDVAIHGFGGCPMAKDDLTGNLATETLEAFAAKQNIALKLNREALKTCYDYSWNVFNTYH